jgi:2-keto-3-deoxy-L-fuconate dehydrogenase
MGTRLAARRAVVTEADDFMGSAIVDLFRDEGASVIEDHRELSERGQPELLIREAGAVDILIINLSIPVPRTPVCEVSDEEWDTVFKRIVTPTHRLVRAELPQMLARRAGKIVVVGGTDGTPSISCFGAARGAQHAYVRNVGFEVARHNVQVNATGQSFARNSSNQPNGGLVSSLSRTSAELVLFLSGAGSDFISGQVFGNSGGMLYA